MQNYTDITIFESPWFSFLWKFYYIKDLSVAQKTESNRWRFNVEFAQKTLNTKVAEWNDGVSFDKTNKISLN